MAGDRNSSKQTAENPEADLVVVDRSKPNKKSRSANLKSKKKDSVLKDCLIKPDFKMSWFDSKVGQVLA